MWTPSTGRVGPTVVIGDTIRPAITESLLMITLPHGDLPEDSANERTAAQLGWRGCQPAGPPTGADPGEWAAAPGSPCCWSRPLCSAWSSRSCDWPSFLPRSGSYRPHACRLTVENPSLAGPEAPIGYLGHRGHLLVPVAVAKDELDWHAGLVGAPQPYPAILAAAEDPAVRERG